MSSQGFPARVLVLARQPDNYAVARFSEVAAGMDGLDLMIGDPHDLYLFIEGGKAVADGIPGGTDGLIVLPRLSSLASEHSLAVLAHLEHCGCKAVNQAASLLRLRHKFGALNELAAAGISVPDSAMLRAPKDVAPAVERLGGYPLVMKFIRGAQGVGIVYVPNESTAVSVLEALNVIQYDVLLQRFYPEAAEQDMRVVVLGGKARWAVSRESAGGDFRTNFHRGGTVNAVDLEAEIASAAESAAGVFQLGLAGVDLFRDAAGALRVMEVNGNPGIEALEAAHGNSVAEDILRHCMESH